MITRSFTWIDENIEHSDADYNRAAALAKKWSALKTEEENLQFSHMAAVESGELDYEFETEEEEQEWRAARAQRRAERDLEIELVEDKLEAIGARMMRPHEHWNEDERYMEYMENRYDWA